MAVPVDKKELERANPLTGLVEKLPALVIASAIIRRFGKTFFSSLPSSTRHGVRILVSFPSLHLSLPPRTGQNCWRPLTATSIGSSHYRTTSFGLRLGAAQYIFVILSIRLYTPGYA